MIWTGAKIPSISLSNSLSKAPQKALAQVARLSFRLFLGGLLLSTFSLVGCEGCAAPVAAPDAGDDPGVACRFNSDCGERSYCGDEGFCLDGLPEGQCLEQSDCLEEFLCVFPDGSDVGACVNPHGCDDIEDCDDGQECVVNSEGFRQCQFTGCESDAECATELGSTCTQNEEAKCIARACQCRDLCGADCGEGRQCCAIENASPMCMGDPGACSKFPCDDGFVGTTTAAGEWNARVCDYDTAECACEELPPLPLGRVGMPHQLLHLDDGRYAVVAYNATYGDLVIGFMDEGEVREWTVIAGVPQASEEAPVVAGPSGPRGGIEAPGDDIGAHLDAIVHPTSGEIHILATDETNGTLLHFSGPAQGPFASRVLESDDEPGYFPKLFFRSSGEAVYAHVAARNDAGASTLRIAAAADFSANPSTFSRYDLRNSALDDVHCQGGCGEGFVCATAPILDGISICLAEGADCSCMGGEVCASTGCVAPGTTTSFGKAQTTDALSLVGNGAEVLLFFHDTRGENLSAFQSSGNLFDGSATFNESVLVSVPNDDMGRNLNAAALSSGGFAVVSASNQRQVWMHLFDDTITLSSSEFLDDGRRLVGPNGPYDQHTVDAPVIGVDVLGSGAALIGWQNGTEGGIYGRSFVEADGLGPSQPLAGGPFSAEYTGTLALGLSAAADGSAVSAQKVLLDEEPGLFSVVMPGSLLSCPGDDEREDDDVLADASSFLEGGHARGMICANDVDVFDLGPVAAGCTIDAELIFKTDDGDLDLYLHTHAEQAAEVTRGFSASDNEFLKHDVAEAASYSLRVEGFGDEENAYILRAMVTCP